MAFKIVGIDENNHFPDRVEDRLAMDFVSSTVVETGRLSEAELDNRYVNDSELDGGSSGDVLTRLDNDGIGWRQAFTPMPGENSPTDWALSITPEDFRAPAGERMNIPTYVNPNGGEATHPSVVYIPNGWNGYRYWMGMTPYNGGNDDYENPSIIASNDGITWTVPEGLTNPIDLVTGDAYNSDTDLLLGVDNKLYLFWRWDSSGTTGMNRWYVSSSSDGITWSPKQLILEDNNANSRVVSSTFIYEDSGLTMWGIDIADNNNRKLIRRRANVTNLNAISPSSWNAPQVCTISYVASGKQPWHFSLRNIDGLYVGLLTDADTGVAGANCDIYMVTSSDGLSFTSGTNVLIPRNAMPNHNSLYRASMIPEINGSTFGFRIWYAAYNSTGPVWGIFRTFATSIKAPNSNDGSVIPEVVSGRFTSVTYNRLTRKNGIAQLVFNASLATAQAVGSTIVKIPVGYRNLSNNMWWMCIRVGDNTSFPFYYDVGTHEIRNMSAIPAASTFALVMTWIIEG